METLRKQLDVECSYRMKDETMDKFLALMEERRELKEREILIDCGEFNDNIYILKEGIVRACYFDGQKEMTFAFALPGTLMFSYYSFYIRDPSFFQLDACRDSVVLKITKAKFVSLLEESADFAQWMFWMSMSQLWFHEKKLETVNGSAKERFDSLFRNRPEIINNVSSKIVASYMGVTPEYLSKLQRLYFRGGRN